MLGNLYLAFHDMIEGADEGKGQVLVGLMVVLLAGPT